MSLKHLKLSISFIINRLITIGCASSLSFSQAMFLVVSVEPLRQLLPLLLSPSGLLFHLHLFEEVLMLHHNVRSDILLFVFLLSFFID